MTRRLVILLVALFALGFTVGACGDDDESSEGGNTPADTPGSGADKGSADESGNDGGAPAASVKQAVDNCKQSIGAQPQLSSAVKKDLEEICEEAGTGDEDGVRKASREVCERMVRETAPPGAARQQALAACEQSATTP